jgi:hypothetical protein
VIAQVRGKGEDIGARCGEFMGPLLDSFCGGSDGNCCASKRAVANPIPCGLPAPVMSATFPEEVIDSIHQFLND